MQSIPTTDPLPGDLISLSAAGRLLGVAPCTIYRWTLRGRLRAWRIGHRWRVRKSDVLVQIQTSVPAPEVIEREAVEARLAEVDAVLRREGIRR